MEFPGVILYRHKWIVVITTLAMAVGVVGSAYRGLLIPLLDPSPEIPFGDIPQSALTYFYLNSRNVFISMFGLILAFWSAFGLGFSIGTVFWLTSRDSLVAISFSHGILEIYSVFLAIVGGLIALKKIGNTAWKLISNGKDPGIPWKQTAEEYLSLLLFSLTGLFVSAWMEAFLAYTLLLRGNWVLIAIENTIISVLIIGFFSFYNFRTTIWRKLVHA